MSDMNGAAPPAPRGILKNRDGLSRYSSLDISPGDPRQRSNRLMNPSSSEERPWTNTNNSGIGNNPYQPPIESQLERYRRKLNDFVDKKKDMLFKPLTPDEMPLAEVKGVQHSVEDHYGVVPSLDHFLRVDPAEIRRYFFQTLQTGDILIASVSSRNNSGLYLKLISTDGGKHVVLEDLGIKSFCPASHMVPLSDKTTDYQTGDYVRVEALEVSADSEKVVCGMKGVTLSAEMQHSFHLGLISRYELPRQFTMAKADAESKRRKTYIEFLKGSNGFQNPNNIDHLASTMGILSNKNSLMIGLRNEFPVHEGAAYLRKIQNGKWAHGNVADGIKFFKLGKFTEAFQCLNKALTIDAENVEGLVARGALHANNGIFEKAIEDFESALKFNSQHYNARKYLSETIFALGKQQEGGGKVEDAVASYTKCLVVKPDQKEAKDALLSLYEQANKVDITKLHGPAVLKAAELKDKLRAILQTELGMRFDVGKIGKDKKSKRKKGKKSSSEDDDSSSTSSSDSDSDSSSSDEGGKRKKKSKRKKKKSKKAKKARGEESKNRALSLSPFSKRLADPQGQVGQGASRLGLSGFGDSSFAEWGQQLGISKKDDSDSGKKSKDKKKSKKKDKRKKKKRGSSSSSDSDSEDSSGEKDRKKSKQKATFADGLGITDLGELEAKLSAYYSKVEQEKISHHSIAPENVKITVERTNTSGGYSRDPYDTSRKVEVKSNADSMKHETSDIGAWSDTKLGKIQLRTDEYGNFIHSATKTIVRTVVNEPPAPVRAPEEIKPIKFEIKKPGAPATGNPSQASGEGGGGSKWRPLGSAPPPGSEDKYVKAPIKNPFELQKFDKDKDHQVKNYRGRKSITPPGKRGPIKRGGGRSDSRSPSSSSSSDSKSKSRSRSRSRSRGRYNRPSRYGDRDGRDGRDFRNGRRGSSRDNRDNRDNRDYRSDRGRGSVRFFRGFNRPTRRPYIPPRNHYKPNGPKDSKFRNRFSRSYSRSRSRSRSRRSISKSLLSRSRSRSADKKDKKRRDSRDLRESIERDRKERPATATAPTENRTEPSNKEQDVIAVSETSEIQIGSLTTTKAADVEELLDKRNAEKKEELRKSNPEFFRN